MQKIIVKNNIITLKSIAMIIISFLITLFLTKSKKNGKSRKKSKIKTFKSTYNFISGTAEHLAVKKATESIKKENNKTKPKEVIIEDAIVIDI